MKTKILIIDDEISILKSLRGVLEDEGYTVFTAETGETGLKLIEVESPQMVLLDIWMEEMDGIEVLSQIKKSFPSTTVIMMSGHGTIETAVRSTKLGAYDFIEKPLSLEKLLILIKNASATQTLTQENQALKNQVKKTQVMIGKSSAIQQIKELVQRVAPTMGSVLISGPNGTGKELVAQHIHALSPRKNQPFIEVNCAAIPEDLIEGELFGHEKGAFTGATRLKKGKFDLAHGGTLFLDEIGDMSLKTQAKILRILQEQKFERVGGNETIAVDVRVVAATNKNLKDEIQAGNFREDLYYRLNVIPFVVPPLKDRKDDIPLLAEHFLEKAAIAYQHPRRAFSKDAVEFLKTHHWPGNVRELKNLIERIIILTQPDDFGKPIKTHDLYSHFESDLSQPQIKAFDQKLKAKQKIKNESKTLKDAKQMFERELILQYLRENEWNISKTAQKLQIERSYLHRKIKHYGLESEG